MEKYYTYIIVGGGLAGVSAVEGIRQRDANGTIALIGKETSFPYNRPWLSKQLWTGKKKPEDNLIKSAEFFSSNHVDLFLGTEIEAIRRGEKSLQDSKGNRFQYDKLLLATGGSPRRLEHDGGAVQYFRTREDYRELRQAAGRHEDFLVIGGGFIGAELAAALSMNGKRVSMLFPDIFLLARVLPTGLAEFVTQYFRQKGVDIFLADKPDHCEKTVNGKVRVITQGEVTIAADWVVAGVGLDLNTRIWQDVGLKVEDGISVDTFLRTTDPSIYAAGDIAHFPSPSLGLALRVEHEDNAAAQGRLAGMNMAGAGRPYTHIPSFYSDLFDLGFEAVGRMDSSMEIFEDWKVPFREGVVYYLESGMVKGVLLWNVFNRVDEARKIIDSKKVFQDRGKLRGLLKEYAPA